MLDGLIAKFQRIRQRKRLWGLSRYCPICRSHLKRFFPYGLTPREDAVCPMCGSLERHRCVYLYLTRKTDLFSGPEKTMLHIAPEESLTRAFSSHPRIRVVTADLSSPSVHVQLDVTRMPCRDDAFDCLLCSHVLEHVPEDSRALNEFFRVIKPGGWAILWVPVLLDKTLEDPTLTTPEDRLRVHGHPEHVRTYGRDFPDRVRSAGFTVSEEPFMQELGPKKTRLFGLENEKRTPLYRCVRPV